VVTAEPVRLDLRGEVCPFTFVRTRLLLETLAIGATVELELDHEPATRSIPRALAEWGQEVLAVRALGFGVWVICARKRVE
jgi:tRNA 2-thiouridine synthesizing protein A